MNQREKDCQYYVEKVGPGSAMTDFADGAAYGRKDAAKGLLMVMQLVNLDGTARDRLLQLIEELENG